MSNGKIAEEADEVGGVCGENGRRLPLKDVILCTRRRGREGEEGHLSVLPRIEKGHVAD